MSKKLLLLALAVGLLLTLGGCAIKQQELKDGYYCAEMAAYKNGWKEFVNIRVSRGEIVSVEYNAKNAAGFIKSWDMGYMRRMNSNAGTYPNRYTRSYGAALLEAQTPTGIDIVTGATSSGGTFKAMCAALLEKAQAGDSTIAIVE